MNQKKKITLSFPFHSLLSSSLCISHNFLLLFIFFSSLLLLSSSLCITHWDFSSLFSSSCPLAEWPLFLFSLTSLFLTIYLSQFSLALYIFLFSFCLLSFTQFFKTALYWVSLTGTSPLHSSTPNCRIAFLLFLHLFLLFFLSHSWHLFTINATYLPWLLCITKMTSTPLFGKLLQQVRLNFLNFPMVQCTQHITLKTFDHLIKTLDMVYYWKLKTKNTVTK